MSLRGLAILVVGAALVAGAAPLAPVQSLPEFIAIVRAEHGAWLLEGSSGSLWFQSREEPPVQKVQFVRKGGGGPWTAVTGFAAVQDGWLVAGQRGRVERYGSDGTFLRDVKVKDAIGDLVPSRGVLWGVPLIVPGPSRHLLLSSDGESFAPVIVQAHGDDVIGTGVTGIVDSVVRVASDLDGGIVVARIVGGPISFRVKLDGSRQAVPLAYRRSARRDALRRFLPTDEDILAYSCPVRDMLVTADGSLVTLRNREDVRTPKGLELRVATVVDRYGRDGRHEASAELAGSARFVARTDGRRVVCISENGRILAGQFGPPRKGGIE